MNTKQLVQDTLKDRAIARKWGDRVDLWQVQPNNHGCAGDSVAIKPTSATEGIVLHSTSCSSCWQTGCDGDASHLPQPGDIVKLPDDHTWKTAAVQADDGEWSDVSFDGFTAVKPRELEIL